MTSSVMLTELRTLLDEAQAGFYENTELYQALTDGQKNVTYYFLNLFKKQREMNTSLQLNRFLLPLSISKNDTAVILEEITFDNSPMIILNAEYRNITNIGNYYPCFVLDPNAVDFNHRLQNEYLKPTDKSPSVFMYYNGGWKYKFLPAFDNSLGGDYILNYLKEPTSISASIEPILAEETHNAIVQWAFSFILRKDDKTQQSAMEHQKYLQMVSEL